MPQQDGTGPNGQGSRTGRGMGNCNRQGGVEIEPGARRGLGRGGGRGRGLGINANQRGNSWLQRQLSALQSAIEKLTEKIK
jgi:hypothetical protein